MTFEHVLAVVPVSDIDSANDWYEKLFGRPADNNPMPNLVEWQVAERGWVQVWVDAERAGSGLLNLAVDDLDRAVADAETSGLSPGQIQEANKGVRLAELTDHDGNTITLVGNFRVQY